MARDIDADSGRPFIKINHPAPGDVIRNPAHVAGYGTAFEGTISLRISDDDGTVIAESSTQGGSSGVIGEFQGGLGVRPQAQPAPWGCGGLRGERQRLRRGPPPGQGPNRLRVAGGKASRAQLILPLPVLNFGRFCRFCRDVPYVCRPRRG
jgi:hypothetical protein